MQIVDRVGDIINGKMLPPGSRIYVSGNAATPQVLLKQIARDKEIKDIELLGVLLLGEIESLFSEECCQRIVHRIIFNGHLSRSAINKGWAEYQLMHLSDIPVQLKNHIRPSIALISVSGPDKGGNFSLGTTVEGVMAAIESAKSRQGLIIAERNAQMPFVLGTTIPEQAIDFLVESDYPLPISPVKQPDQSARRIGEIIAQHFIDDGTTLQYGLGQVPEAVTDAILAKGVKDLGIHTELFADAMQRLVDAGVVTNRFTFHNLSFSLATIFLAQNADGYRWLDYNSSVQSRPADYTNAIANIAREPNMVAINSAMGVDLHGNIWADSLQARQIYSCVGGQADFIRGAYQSKGGLPIIALKATTPKGQSKIVDKCPEGITTTAIAADPVILVTEYGAFDPRGLSIVERAVGIAHLAEPHIRERLLQHICDSAEFHNPARALRGGIPKGVMPYGNL